MAISTEPLRRVPLETDLQRRMSLMTALTILAGRILAMAEMAPQTGRHAGMTAMAGDAIAIMRPGIGHKLRFDLLVATGTDRAMAAHPDQIIL